MIPRRSKGQKMKKNIKFWHSLEVKPGFLITDNHNTVIITTYRECYDITRNIGIVYLFFFFFNLELCFKVCLFPRDNSWFWYRRKLYLYTARYLALSHAHHALLLHHSRNRKSCIIDGLFRDHWFYFVAMLFHYLYARWDWGCTWTVTSFRFPFSLIRSKAQWHKHPTSFFFFFFFMFCWFLNHRLLRL